MTTQSSRRYATPIATYRLQLTPEFGFAQALEIVPYLHQIGISHLYLSPFFEASPGSPHGYDVVDHNQVRRDLGGVAGLYELGEALASHDIGLIADFVPNHVGIGKANPWWMDVLRYGRESPFSAYFDIDWEAQPQMTSGVLRYPILGQSFGHTLEAGELRIVLEDNDLMVTYYDHRLPLAPRTYSRVLGMPPIALRDSLGDPVALSTFVETLDGLRQAPREDAEPMLTTFRTLLASEPALEAWVEETVGALNGVPGDSASFDALEEVLLEQHYRLTDWRVSGEEINYRRFFDINHLAGIRVEREDVFEDVHRLLLELVQGGIVTGVRIDHVDGLYDPAGYLARLRQRLDEVTRGIDGAHVPIYVEKILEHNERLQDWDTEGTTGYEFIGQVEALFVDRSGAGPMTGIYRDFTSVRQRFDDVVYDSKLHIASTAFAGELNVLAWQIYRLAQRHRLHRDITLRGFRRAITGVMACFPVYRTYVGTDPGDAAGIIDRAIRDAERRDPTLSTSALAFLREVLLLGGELDEEEMAPRIHFRRRFQQLSGPVMAKGLEDTAFYRYVRLISLNEVGADPSYFGADPAEVHRWLQERAERWPHTLSAGTTHDTKRSEDVRARLHVLSEVPVEWRREVSAWQRMNQRHRTTVGAEQAPDLNSEYYLYQTLVGSWPEGRITHEYTERVCEHMLKAIREAKLVTSWIRASPEYEQATLDFTRAVLDPRRSGGFIRRVERFVERIRPAGALNALSMLTLRCLAPGVPDFYQGTELPALLLTDPDNRRPVDFAERKALLDAHAHRDGPPNNVTAPETRFWLARRLLDVRATHRDVIHEGDYRSLSSAGDRGAHVFAFARCHGRRSLVVAVPRLVFGLCSPSGEITTEAWGDTTLDLPGDTGWRNLLTGDMHEAGACSELFAPFPIAVLEPVDRRG